MSSLRKILSLLTPSELRRSYLLLVMILIMAILDTIGVASIMPFMVVLGNPKVIETNHWLSLAYKQLNFSEPKNFLFFIGSVVFLLLVVSSIFKALTQWALLRFTNMRGYSLSCRLFFGYLGRPYTWFLNRHSADIGKAVLSEVTLVINGVLVTGMQLIAQAAVAICLFLLLVLMNPLLAVVVSLVLGGAYLIIYITIRRYLSRIGDDRVIANRQRFQVAQEALGGIKEVKVFNREQTFYRQFKDPSWRFAKHQTNNQVAAQLPRYALEIVAFGGILLLTLYLLQTTGGLGKTLPRLVVYAFAGYKLLPALQQIYMNMTKLRFNLPAVEILYNDMVEISKNEEPEPHIHAEPIIPHRSIELHKVYFTYQGAKKPALQGLELKIPVQSTVGLVGATGSGKTTTVDLILGLLRPDEGQLFVDDVAITAENIRAWQRALGYVPQHIYLSDDTVAANIAFGIPPEKIDLKAVERAARIAELHEFVIHDLPQAYKTLIGERGVRLSGGQRQRIGIARALYSDPSVLIFDEATSALDNLTEKSVMHAIYNLGRVKTIILIAHRLTTVRKCDTIFLLEKGKLIGSGNYDELLLKEESFQKMVNSTETSE
jgi:ABC-type multidrug transport system fused ATPase/permease subunit